MRYFAVAAALMMPLAGCGAFALRQEAVQLRAAYKACLAEHPKDVAACKKEKEAYEDGMQGYLSESHPFARDDEMIRR